MWAKFFLIPVKSSLASLVIAVNTNSSKVKPGLIDAIKMKFLFLFKTWELRCRMGKIPRVVCS